MGVSVTQLHHIQILVPRAVEQQAKHFYGTLLGLEETLRPERYRSHGGTWYAHGPNQIHLSLTNDPTDNATSRRHFCLMVADLAQAEQTLREAGVEIMEDTEPIAEWVRFYVRDPGDNKIEIAQMKT